MKQKYALEKSENRACATGLSLPISLKHSVEVCNFIRNKKLETAIASLREVSAGKIAVPYRRYNQDLGHKRGMAAGRYPKKTCKEIIRLLESIKANAEDLGLGESLVIKHISASNASAPWHYGRQRRRKTKRTHIKLVVEEMEERKEEKRKRGQKKEEVKKAESQKHKTIDAAGALDTENIDVNENKKNNKKSPAVDDKNMKNKNKDGQK